MNNPADSLQELPARQGFSLIYRGKTLLSRIDPVLQAERLAAGIPLKERTLYFCPSPLYGYGLPALLRRLEAAAVRSSAILCAEADAALYGLSEKSFAENPELLAAAANGSFRRLALTGTSDPEKLSAFVLKTWGGRIFRRVEVIHLSAGWQLFPRLYEDAVLALRREIAVEWGNAMTMIRLGRLYARNFIRNLRALSGGGNSASPCFDSAPVLVLGAGPSLDTLLGGLARLSGGEIPGQAERRFRIVCVDTCLPALTERSILPDLAVILESQHWNLRDFIGERGRPIDAMIDLSALPASTRVLGGKRSFFATIWTELRLFRRLKEAELLPEVFIPMGSVGLSAVALALRLGSGPVLVGGIDFSFSADAYHARSTPGHADKLRANNRFRSLVNAAAAFREGTFPAVSKDGSAVRSDPAMRNYRNLFEQEFGGNPRLFDIEGPGLKLGIKTLKTAEAFALLNGKDARPPEPEPALAQEDGRNSKLAAFIEGESRLLEELKTALSGEKPARPERLEELLDDCDYLWAHFPDCAGADGRRPPAADLGFLKRVRMEIDPFLDCWKKDTSPKEYS